MISRTALLALLPALAQAVQPSAPDPIPAPLRNLPWGQLNFLHTTDTHGWHGGHLQEPSYSADWGDYISFAHHMRKLADDAGYDMLLIDTGDRIEGNGLYDGSEPKGKYYFDIFKQQDIDVICTGNHELYKANSSENEYNITVPNFKGNYLASNLDIIDPHTGEFIPLAKRYRKFTSKNLGLRITAFGFIFDFKANANNTRVQPVAETVKEKWFQDAVKDKDVDLFLVIGHVDIRSEEYETIFKSIRDHTWSIPIQFFGGHSHIRDYKIFDKASVALESGRYMETIGFMSINGISKAERAPDLTRSGLTFHRRYIDNNLYSLYHHSQTNSTTFPTELGNNVTKQITEARKELELDSRHGCAPQDYWVNRAEYDSPDSIFPLLRDHIFPDTLKGTGNSSTRPKIALANTGAMRFDIFKGPFTKDSTFLISPFTNSFRYIKDVDWSVAKKLLEILNNQGQVIAELDQTLSLDSLVPAEQLAIDRLTSKSSSGSSSEFWQYSMQSPLSDEPALIPGYTTKDDDGDQGDDTKHSPIPFYRVPNCVQAEMNFPEDRESLESVDIIYNEFIQPWIILGLRFLGAKYEVEDTLVYEARTMTDLISDWVEDNWPCEE